MNSTYAHNILGIHGIQHESARRAMRSKSVAAGGILLMALSAGDALADPEVVLYGVIEAGGTYANPVASEASGSSHRVAMTSGSVGGTYVGIRGTEDLGGGASAIFTIEQAFDASNGTASDGQPMFVGLSHPDWGTVTLGLQYDAINDYLSPLTLTGSDGGTYFAHPFDADNANASVLTRNTIKWASPDWGGIHVGGQYAVDSNSAGHQDWSVGAAYEHGPLTFGAAYARYADRIAANVPGWGIRDALAVSSNDHDATVGTPSIDSRVGWQVYGAGINYAIGEATLGAVYSHVRLDGRTAGGAGQVGAERIDLDNYEVNARYQVMPAVRLSAGFTHTQGKLRASSSTQRTAWNQIGVQANYAMSRRTDLYVEGVHQRTIDDAPLAYINGIGASGTDEMSALAVGVRHTF